MRRLLVSLIVGLMASQSVALDLGKYGEIYPISEQDLFQRMAYEATRETVQQGIEERQKQARDWFEGAPDQTSMPFANETRSFFVRHQMEVTSDFQVPVLVDRDTGEMVQTPTRNISFYRVEQRLIAEKGDVINPMDNPTFKLQNRFLVFNPTDPRQLDFAMEAADYHDKLMLVATEGDILDMSKKSDKPVHLLFPSMVDIFALKRVPALMGEVELEGEKVLSVTEIGSEDLDVRKVDDFFDEYWGGPSSPDDAEVVEIKKTIDPKRVMRQFGRPQQ